MNITADAKTIIETMFSQRQSDCLKASLRESCCGSYVFFLLGKQEEGDDTVLIDGVPVVMDEETGKRAETLTIEANEGRLVFNNSAAPAGDCC